MVVVVIMYNKSTIKHITFKNKKLLKPKKASYRKEKKLKNVFEEIILLKCNPMMKLGFWEQPLFSHLIQVGLDFQTLMFYPLIHNQVSKVFELIQNVEDVLTNIGKQMLNIKYI